MDLPGWKDCRSRIRNRPSQGRSGRDLFRVNAAEAFVGASVMRRTGPVTNGNSRTAPERPERRSGRAFLLIFVLSFSVQVFLLTKVPESLIRPHTRWEMQAVATSLAETGRFSDPYVLPTGPTAHLPPIPPALLGLVYRLFGSTLTAGYVAWLVSIATYAAMWGMLPWLAAKAGLGKPVGILAGIAGALTPQWPGHGEGLAGVSILLLMAAFLSRWIVGRATPARSLLLGIAAGIAFHVQPAILPVVLGWLAFELWWSRGRQKRRLTAVIALGMVIACLPWAWRNYHTLDAVFFVRSNLGLELRMGNHDGAAAAMDVMDRMGEHAHPRTHEGEARKLKTLGEAVYMRQAGQEAFEWIRAHPASFVRLTMSRVRHWWLGPLSNPSITGLVSALTILALAGACLILPTLSAPQRAALLIPFLAYPLVYYVVAYMPRYRQPIDWIFFLLAAAAVWRLIGGRRTLSDRRTTT
jgi:4-amino-4-deoxy-L-arabinose transferase-like glycosyltransferase